MGPRKYVTDSEKKRARAARDKIRNTHRVFIGVENMERWQVVKEGQGLVSDEDVAAFLLNSYDRLNALATSTPFPVPQAGCSATSPHMDFSTAEEASVDLSGVSSIKDSIEGASYKQRRLYTAEPMDQSGDFDDKDSNSSDPLGLNVIDSKDITYRPSDQSLQDYISESSINKRVYQIDAEDLEELTPDDLLHTSTEDTALVEDPTDGFPLVTSASSILEDATFLGYTSCIMSLAKLHVEPVCKKQGCRAEVSVTAQHIGTAVVLTWTCQMGHVANKWSSQPRLVQRGINAGDFMVATNILLSGNNYAKISLFFKYLGLKAPGRTFFYNIQAHYCVPVINEYWEELLARTMEKYRGQDLILSGDGRNDSPGHSSQFCTYTLMHEDNHDLMAVIMVDKRETNLKSPNMEPLGLRKALAFLIEDNKMNVAEVVTDAHSQIPPILRELGIVHQWDVWHGGKNLGKKLNAVAARKECATLASWVKDIVKHFWKASEMAQGSPDMFKSDIRGVLHHVTDEHEWALGDGSGPGSCRHDPLPEGDRDKEWIEAESPAHKGLAKVILDKTWLSQAAQHYCNFRHTGQLEVFHQLILMYAAKRYAFSPPVYKARILLAAIDFQHHKDREYKRNQKNEIMFGRVYNKRSQNWCPVPLRVAKDYGYMKVLQVKIIEARLTDELPLRRRVVMAADDPRTIRPTIAAVDPKPTKVLTEEHESRLGDKVKWKSATQ